MEAQDSAIGARAGQPRVTTARRQFSVGGLSLVIATEDVHAPTDWSFADAQHRLVVHLAGQLDRMESVFSRGPSSAALPSIGDIWAIPGESRYAALAQGQAVTFAEFSLTPAEARALPHSAPMRARVAHRDALLHQLALKAARLAERSDDLAQMAMQSLLHIARLHILDDYFRPGRPGAPPADAAAALGNRLSQRQQLLLVERVDERLHESLSVEQLAGWLGLSVAQLLPAFRASFGLTPWQYVLKARLEAARRLLDADGLSVTEIAGAVGFSSRRACSHYKREMRWLVSRMDARSGAPQVAVATCKHCDAADAAIRANPQGRTNVGRITALRLVCVAGLHRTRRALCCIPAFILRTPVCSVNRP